MRLLLVNPNTNTDTTVMMTQIARGALQGEDNAARSTDIEGITAQRGVALITNETALAEAESAVCERLTTIDLSAYAGIIIAAFGDPGLAATRQLSPIPVTGIAEAAMAEAEGRFAVVTTTPDLAQSITDTAIRYGHQAYFAGVVLTPGDPATLMTCAEALLAAMLAACHRAIEAHRPDSIVIGGGPLARIARELRPLLPVPVIEPIPAAVRLAMERARN